MKKFLPFILLLSLPFCTLFAQNRTKNIIIITTDGLRWQELFTGIDPELAGNKDFNQDSKEDIYKRFWDENPEVRREKLFPFIWGTLAKQGQIYGNRIYNNKVDVSNYFNVSYPGYNEMLTGYADKNIKNNDFADNPNTNVLEFINQQESYRGKVAAFGAWAAFPYILNKNRNRLPVFSAFDNVGGSHPTANEKLINQMLQDSFKPWGQAECLDVFTHYAAMEYLRARKPSVLYISYGETDEWAHAGKYRYYLDAAHQFDRFVQQIWNFVQENPEYKDQTTLLITTDHGRGDKNKREWTSHGSSIPESDQIWLAAIGPDIQARGEIKRKMQLYQKQIAQTIAAFMGLTFTSEHPVAEKIKPLFEEK